MSSSAKLRRTAALDTPTDLKPTGVLNILLADMFALYLKTKNFHWHVSGPHFRDYGAGRRLGRHRGHGRRHARCRSGAGRGEALAGSLTAP
jgi:hypothetical protein